MRAFEIGLILITAAGAVRPLLPGRNRPLPAALTVVAITVVAAAHLAFEWPRWQLLPVYVVAALAAVVAGMDAVRRPTRRGRMAPCLAGLVLVLLGAAAAWALPVIDLAPPGGRHTIGTRTFELVDPQRPEIYGQRPAAARRIVVQLWYPAEEPQRSATPAPWLPAADGAMVAAADWWEIPSFALSHLRLVRGNALADAPPDLRQGPRPLVLASHGWGGFRGAQATQMEALASRGYVVAAVDHTYGALATVFPDGEVVPISPDALPAGVDRDTYEDASATLVRTFAEDLRLVLDHFAQGGTTTADLVDLDRVGVLGHSAGGGAAILLCATEPRCKAVLTYDAWVEPLPDEVVGSGLDVPLLSLRSEEWTGNGNDSRLRRLHAADAAPDGVVTVHGALHRDFTLLPAMTPLASWLGLSGPTGHLTVQQIANAWTTRWFDHHLRHRGVDPLIRPPDHPAATLETS